MANEPHLLTSSEDLNRARVALAAVFRNFDPFESPVSADVEGRTLGFPFAGYIPPDTWQYLADWVTSHFPGDQVFIHELEGEKRSWECPFEPWPWDALFDDRWDTTAEFVVVGSSGRWGILISYEWHAVLAGPPGLIEHLMSRDERFSSESVHGMLSDWRRLMRGLPNEDDGVAWLTALLEHVYGEAFARDSLSEGQR